jgi:hypothetical protein
MDRLGSEAGLGVIHRLGELFESGLAINPDGEYFRYGVVVSHISQAAIVAAQTRARRMVGNSIGCNRLIECRHDVFGEAFE